MTLDVNKEELTILGIPFDNFSDFDTRLVCYWIIND